MDEYPKDESNIYMFKASDIFLSSVVMESGKPWANLKVLWQNHRDRHNNIVWTILSLHLSQPMHIVIRDLSNLDSD